MILIRINSTGNEYAVPNSKYSELPVMRVVNGFPQYTSFSRHELMYMVDMGTAEIVGNASVHINISYNEVKEK
ncbi:hypothetical protein PJM39_0085 [Salmonella phage vB_SenS_UTK0006]|uniref:Phage protein n=1 Tax=Salmonella phage vB_SenS_UTK0006 TaxID=3028904 RepID=A0AAE9ZJ81_9CAUD|nr:hypothetical protein PJM39_0085 [Salmonella phage vB_SenS_UTK0006]